MNSIERAYQFYSRHIYDQEKIELLKQYNLKIAGSVPSVLWELFGALLTNRSAQGNTGADLVGWEIKSAKNKGSYEYQYHLNTGEEKLKEDCLVNHLFFMYSATYHDVAVRAMQGKDLAKPYFKKWMPLYRKNYDPTVPASQRRQRFRKSISAGHIIDNGELILEIKNGTLVYEKENVITQFNNGTK